MPEPQFRCPHRQLSGRSTAGWPIWPGQLCRGQSGIHGFTKGAKPGSAAKGITVNAIAPGYIDTDMVAAVTAEVLAKIVARIPVGRLGKATRCRGVLS